MKFFQSSFYFSTLPAALRSASGWRRLGYAFVFGSVMSLTMPPYNLFPFLWLCFPALIFLLQGTENLRSAFLTGWCFAFGFFVFSLYWIAAAMFVDIAHFWWAIPLSVAGLPAFFALYYGFISLIAQLLGLRDKGSVLLFGLLWFLADYARGHMATGFPWNLVGYTWSGALPVLQITSSIGIYGLTLLTTVAACLPAAVVDYKKGARLACAMGILLFFALALWGELKLQKNTIGTVANVRLRLVQPDIQQAQKWQASERERYFQDLLDMTAVPATPPVTHIIWPETASTFYLSEDAVHRQEIAMHIPAAALVLTGVIREDMDDAHVLHYYNSLVAVDGLGRIVAGYDKTHLVPFGEYMPWRRFLPLKTLAASGVDFTAGQGPRSLRVLGLPTFSPLICYEAIFPGKVVDQSDRPDFILNVTNDGWYGHTIGPYQHFAIVRVRAIEEGLPLVRVANTGITAIINPLGQITKRLGLGKHGYIDGDLPLPLPPTFFDKWQEKPLWGLFVFACMVCGLLKWHRMQNIKNP